jgi:hypothetical protein
LSLEQSRLCCPVCGLPFEDTTSAYFPERDDSQLAGLPPQHLANHQSQETIDPQQLSLPEPACHQSHSSSPPLSSLSSPSSSPATSSTPEPTPSTTTPASDTQSPTRGSPQATHGLFLCIFCYNGYGTKTKLNRHPCPEKPPRIGSYPQEGFYFCACGDFDRRRDEYLKHVKRRCQYRNGTFKCDKGHMYEGYGKDWLTHFPHTGCRPGVPSSS